VLTELEVRAIAQRVVDETKATARVRTGKLRRSISYTYVGGVVYFRQLFYGVYNDNAKLEQNAARYMPREVPYLVVNVNLSGETVEVGRTSAGRLVQRLITREVTKQTTKRARAAVASKIARDGKAQN
jgi:hypothetical protein